MSSIQITYQCPRDIHAAIVTVIDSREKQWQKSMKVAAADAAKRSVPITLSDLPARDLYRIEIIAHDEEGKLLDRHYIQTKAPGGMAHLTVTSIAGEWRCEKPVKMEGFQQGELSIHGVNIAPVSDPEYLRTHTLSTFNASGKLAPFSTFGLCLHDSGYVVLPNAPHSEPNKLNRAVATDMRRVVIAGETVSAVQVSDPEMQQWLDKPLIVHGPDSIELVLIEGYETDVGFRGMSQLNAPNIKEALGNYRKAVFDGKQARVTRGNGWLRADDIIYKHCHVMCTEQMLGFCLKTGDTVNFRVELGVLALYRLRLVRG